MISDIKEELSNGNLEFLIEDAIEKQKTDLLIILEYAITTPENQKNNTNKNISKINLGKCENRLKEIYHINENESLIIFKIDYYEEGLLIPIVEYEVYSKKKGKLDLNYCKDIKINIDFPVVIDEKEEFKYNYRSKYYNDVCFTYTKDNKTDISLYDRKKEFTEKNMSLCESKCEYNGYDIDTKRASCECEIKIKLPFISEIIINKDKLSKRFTNIKSYMNLNVIKCWKLLFTKEGIITNIGSYLILVIVFICFILLFLFLIEGYKEIYKKIIIIKDKIKIMNNNKKNNNFVRTTKNSNKNIKIKRKKRKFKNQKIKYK